MIATVSPTTVGAGPDRPHRPSTSRLGVSRYSSKPNMRRALQTGPQFKLNAPIPQWKFASGDSSDDEIPVAPMKFSAEAKALLGDEASVMESSSPSQKEQLRRNRSRESLGLEKRRYSPPSLGSNLREQYTSPSGGRSASPRIVRLNATSVAPSTLRRTQSVREDSNSPSSNEHNELVTPAPRTRTYQGVSPRSRSGSLPAEHQPRPGVDPISGGSGNLYEVGQNVQDHPDVNETAGQMENLSIDRIRNEHIGPQTTLRQSRGLKVTGRFLSGPARRGLKRRQSDEDQSPVHEADLPSKERRRSLVSGQNQTDSANKAIFNHFKEALDPEGPSSNSENNRPPHVRFNSQANIITGSPDAKSAVPARTALTDSIDSKSRPSSISNGNLSSGKRIQPLFKVPPLPSLPSRFDQENEPPPTFKRNKPGGVALSDRLEKLSVMTDEKMLAAVPATLSPKRPALAPRSQNTPHRPAPPPPKMTVLETATATAGAASASQARKKRNQYMSVNGRYFTRMDCIGRGGSSKVYRVMAENYKIFALKRVTLEDQDELAIRGYKGEIDLLRRLENVDRVVRLFDYEINEEKHTLSVLMEMGESDLNRVLTLRLNAEDARLDITFTRYFWKEMLECVQAVHAHDIVHSDLKPANFLLLQGRLKLIDFGISNAIAENTVNVHREQHIGTPNYMSPEALIDSNAAAGLPSSEGKMMKLGKPSDVWSLGCILYQMVYGKPPFAHIANQMQRIMAIPNHHHQIAFPETGIGGIVLPTSLIRTLRRCLSRNQTQRPTVEELLASNDPFLFPDLSIGKETVPVGQELIARLQHNIVKHIREKGMPSDAELGTWPARFFASIKVAVEEGRA